MNASANPAAGARRTPTCVVLDDPAAVDRALATLVAERVGERFHLGAAAGRTFEGAYDELVDALRGRDLSGLRLFQLDEYVGVPGDDPISFRDFVRTRLEQPLGLESDQVDGPNGAADDPHAEAAAYDARVRSAGVDVQLLGIGRTGHIGFNEPPSPADAATRVVALTADTHAANQDLFGPDRAQPTHGLTLGVATILGATEVVLVAKGANKAAAVAAALTGPVTGDMPASALQLHPRCTFLLDRAAAAALPEGTEIADALP